MTVLMRQYMRERDRVIGLIGRTRKNPDVLENPRVTRIRIVNWEPEVFPGPSNQGQMRFSPPKEESSREASMESDKARETRTKDSRGHSAAEGRPVRSRKKTTQ
ncbi:hypothetical protein TNCV_2584671 [Trichonephila clavipes]|nr:hypothetical protein TNCV_2584671 [Trichonephila clavipes]